MSTSSERAAEVFTTKARLRRALMRGAAVWGVLGVLHFVADARMATAVLSGTEPASVSTALGAFYVVAWLFAVLVEPIVVLEAVLFTFMEYASNRACSLRPFRRSPRPDGSSPSRS